MKEDVSGEIDINGTLYKEILEADAYDDNAISVYLTSIIYFTDVAPSVTFRQTGILANPLDSEGEILTEIDYLAVDVGDQGILHFIENHTPIVRNEDQSESFKFLITF